MADLKAGTTVGGNLVWHQGNFPLKSVTEDVYYKDYKIYTTYNKPQAVDNDFVSKAQGGTYLGSVSFDVGLNIKSRDGYMINLGSSTAGPYTARFKIADKFGFETSAGTPFAFFDPDDSMDNPRFVVMGPMSSGKYLDRTGKEVYSPVNAPKPADVGLGNVSNDAQVKINFQGLQTMAGPLVAPYFSSINKATNGDQVPRLDQVISKDVTIDFGTF